MNLFEELAKDAKADLDSKIFFPENPATTELNKAVAEMEKKMDEQMKKHLDEFETLKNGKQQADAPVNDNVPDNNNDGEESTDNNEVN